MNCHGLWNRPPPECLYNSFFGDWHQISIIGSHHWPCAKGIHRWQVDSPHKGPSNAESIIIAYFILCLYFVCRKVNANACSEIFTRCGCLVDTYMRLYLAVQDYFFIMQRRYGTSNFRAPRDTCCEEDFMGFHYHGYHPFYDNYSRSLRHAKW